MPLQDGQVKFSSGTIKRGKISAPIQLLSTTNMLAYDAPDIYSRTSSSASSLHSPRDSELSSAQQSISTPTTSPEGSTHESSPLEAASSASHFPQRSATVTTRPQSPKFSSADAPLVPKRALSHTKRSHQDLAHQRSLKRTSPPSLRTARSNPSTKTTEDTPKAEPHPFGRELAQVNEVVEDFGGGYALEEEEAILQQKGLLKFIADEYTAEIEALYSSIFGDQLCSLAPCTWV